LSGHGPPRIALRRSRLFAVWLWLVHLATLAPLWLSGSPPFALGALTAVILMHGGWTTRRHALLADPGSIVAIALDDSHRVALFTRSGQSIHGEVAETTLVTGHLVVLAMRTGRYRTARYLVLLPDMLDADDFRQLRVRLKWTRQAPVASQS